MLENKRSSFQHGGSSTGWYMRQVLWALLPGITLLTIFFGRDILFNILIASMSAFIFEAFILKLRKKTISSLLDSSVLVTAWLIAVSVPATLSPFLLILGVFFAVVIAKHLYGGLGHNIFNPAMVAYVVLLVSFPLAMSQWHPASIPTVTSTAVDAISQATPLDLWHHAHKAQWQQQWMLINVAWLLGGIYLLIRGLIPWQTVFGFLVGLLILTLLGQGFHVDSNALWLQLFSGGTMLAAFFIVTDPVTSATTPLGRIIFGAGVAVFTYLIRYNGGYPDGIAFGVLLMNCGVPLIDYYTRPRVFGR